MRTVVFLVGNIYRLGFVETDQQVMLLCCDRLQSEVKLNVNIVVLSVLLIAKINVSSNKLLLRHFQMAKVFPSNCHYYSKLSRKTDIKSWNKESNNSNNKSLGTFPTNEGKKTIHVLSYKRGELLQSVLLFILFFFPIQMKKADFFSLLPFDMNIFMQTRNFNSFILT